MNIFETIKNSFHNKVEFEQKRPGIYQIFLPIYHEDGDMVDLYVEQLGEDKYVLSDFGKTLQHLSYHYDIDTPKKEDVLEQIILDNNLSENKGIISLVTSGNDAFMNIMHITQAFAKIGSMKYFNREVVESMFYEILREYIFKNLQDFKPKEKVKPIIGKPELEVDFTFTPNGHDVYLMGIKQSGQARMAAINFLHFKLAKLNFRGWVVYDSFEDLSKKDIALVTDASEKQFTSIDNLKDNINYYLEKERQ
jgi:hypothetical protein